MQLSSPNNASQSLRAHGVKGVFAKIWSNCRDTLRSLVYPGLDLHTRDRASLGVFWKTGSRDVLDAGCGNGYFSWLAYESGARVLAVNFSKEQVEKARAFLLGYKRADRTRLQIEQFNLYNLGSFTRQFDEIICYEVLEHIRRDRDVLQEFYRILRPGGVLHLCCPYRLHPQHLFGELDENETGGHVRTGYTEQDYRALLEPLGFQIDKVVGLGSPRLNHVDRVVRIIRNSFGDGFALPLFPFVVPFVWFEKFNPPIPFSLYVRAVKSFNDKTG